LARRVLHDFPEVTKEMAGPPTGSEAVATLGGSGTGWNRHLGKTFHRCPSDSGEPGEQQ
jgi:hypothetical protein